MERHTEFVALTYCGDARPAPHIREIISACPGTLLTGTRVILKPEEAQPSHQQSVVSTVFHGPHSINGITVETDFRVRDNGMFEYRLSGPFDDGAARGRLVKLILDLETYRMAALLSLPQVRTSMPQLQRLEQTAQEATRQLSRSDDASLGAEIDTLSNIHSEVGALQESVRFRLAASRAYYDLVKARLGRLNEHPIGQQHTLEGFVDFQLTPAMNTINAFERRIYALSTNVRSSMALARTRLDLIAQQQNQSLLRSMERRARQQVHLSQAVEGLSIAAITYYAVGLLAYVLKGLPQTWVNDSVIVALAVPVIALLVWTATRRATRQFQRLDEGE